MLDNLLVNCTSSLLRSFRWRRRGRRSSVASQLLAFDIHLDFDVNLADDLLNHFADAFLDLPIELSLRDLLTEDVFW